VNTDIERISTDLATWASGIVVKDQESADRANELLLAGKDAIRKITAFKPLKQSADEAKRQLLEKEKAELAKVEPVVKRLDGAITSWKLEEDRKRREAEAVAYRAEQERIRLEAEAMRKVKEAEEAAEKERLRLEQETEDLQRKEREALAAGDKDGLAKIEEKREEIHQEAQAVLAGVEKATDEAIDEAAKGEAALAPAPVIPPPARTEGSYIKHNYSFLVENKTALPEKYKVADQTELNKMARQMGEEFKVPGGRVVDNPTTASIGRRNGAGLN
jgi:hypothetical protein